MAPHTRRAESPIALRRVVGLWLLLVLEVCLLAWRVPTERWDSFARGFPLWAVSLLDFFWPCAVGSLLAILRFRGRQMLSLLNQPSGRTHAVFCAWLGVYLACLGGHLALTVGVLTGTQGTLVLPAWIAATIGMLTSLALTLLPGGSWLGLARTAFLPALGGAVVVWAARTAFSASLGLWWKPLTVSTLVVVSALLHLFTSDVHADPEHFIIGMSAFSVRIGPGCSGYEGIGLIWMFLAVYLWSVRQRLRFPQAFLLIPIGTGLIWFANAIRLVLLIGVGAYWSPDLAMGGFHSNMGAVMFTCVGMVLMAASHGLGLFRKAEAQPLPSPAGANPVAAYLAPLMTVIGLILVCGALTAGFDYLYPVRVVGGALALYGFSRHLARGPITWSWTAVALGVLGYALWIALVPTSAWATGPHMPLALRRLPWPGALGWIGCRVIGSVIIVPLVEELAFRGFLTRRIQAADFESVPLGRFSWPSFLASSILFGLLHGRWFAGTLAGMLYALALYHRRRLSDAIIAHATTNALLAVHVLAADRWLLW